MRFVTVKGIPIVGTGEYPLASGTRTFTQEELADAVRAAQDPTVPSPRIKLGHTDTRFESAVAAGLDGEPAFGTVTNMRLANGGQQIIGDLTDVPEWLADSMQSAYPGRSIEGLGGFKAASGRQYSLAISALSLLGVQWPGVTSLPDLREILEQNGQAPEPVAAEHGFDHADGHALELMVARISRPGDDAPVASIDLGAIRQQFCTDLDAGRVPVVAETNAQAYWWPRSIRAEDDGRLTIIVDDDAGNLIRVPFTTAGTDLSYGDPQLVIEEYVAASAATKPRTLASWPVRAARPSNTSEVQLMDIDPAVLRTRLGLAEDADEAAITEALSAPVVEPEPEPAPVPVAPQIPEGMVLVDEATFAQVQEGAAAGVAVAARLAAQDRDEVIMAAAREGRFPIGRRNVYEHLWERDAEGTRHLLTASVDQGGLAPGVVPVGPEVGVIGDGENQPEAISAEYDAWERQTFGEKPTSRRVTVRTEA